VKDSEVEEEQKPSEDPSLNFWLFIITFL
jgi:hypothetical protein